MSLSERDLFGSGEYAWPENRVISRALLCLVPALVDGFVATFIVFTTGFIYNVVVLGEGLNEFAWPLYLGYGIVAGSFFGAFSASACSRLLDGGKPSHAALPESFYAWTAAIALTLLLAFLNGGIGDLSRVSLTSAYLLGIPVVIGIRGLWRGVLTAQISEGSLSFERIAVVGDRDAVVRFLARGELSRSGHQLTDTLYLDTIVDPQGALRIEDVVSFARLCVSRGTSSILMVGAFSEIDALEPLVEEMKRFSLNLIFAPTTANMTLKLLQVLPIGPSNALLFLRRPMSDVAVVLKRSLDLVLSSVGLIILAPLFLVVAIAIKLESPGPVIYRQARLGFNGETFMIWKFRSMSVTEDGSNMTQARRNDSRITRVGRLLRSLSIDELPQLVNVLLGQMSIVGPRPHALSHDAQLSRQLTTYAHRQRIKPGITGWAQVNGYRGETQTFEQIEGRVVHDLHYINNWSLFFDLWIILLTVISPSTHRNAR